MKRSWHGSVAFAAALAVAQPLEAQVENVGSAQLRSLIESGIAVVDVRTPAEWKQTGVLPGSRLLTFFDERGAYDVDAWLKSLREIAARGDPVVLICQQGVRSKVISRFLDEQVGYERVYDAVGGIADWIRQGLPTVAP